jgi:hypothetical protein
VVGAGRRKIDGYVDRADKIYAEGLEEGQIRLI